MKKILITTDFSDAADNAFRYGLHLANHLGARVTLLHVYNAQNISKSEIPENFQKALEEEDEEQSLSYLEAHGELIKIGATLNIEAHYILEKGNPSDKIAKYADFMEADLIVMGNNGYQREGNLINNWFGNVVNKVVEKTHQAILIVPEKVKYTPLDHIIYATNFEEKIQRVPTELGPLTAPFSGKISCVHVRKPSDRYVNEIYFDLYKDIYKLEMENFNIRFYTITQQNVLEGLDRFIRDRSPNLLAMLANKHLTVIERLFGPTLTEQMAFHTHIPLLILQEEI